MDLLDRMGFTAAARERAKTPVETPVPRTAAADEDDWDDAAWAAAERADERESVSGRLDAIEEHLEEIRARVGFPYVKISLLLGAFYLLGKLL